MAWFYGRALHDYYHHSHEGGGGGGGHHHHHHHHPQQQMMEEHSEMKNKVEVIFLSDDAQSRKLALLEQPPREEDDDDDRHSDKGTTTSTKGGGLYYTARSMRDHVTLLQREDPTLNLLDMVANFNVGPGGGGGNTAMSSVDGEGSGDIGGGGFKYAPHVASSALSHGLRTNRYYQGVYRSNRDSYTDGYVTIRQGEDRVAVVVNGREDVNRAVDGDIVAVELFAIDHWLTTTATSLPPRATTAAISGGSVEANESGSSSAIGRDHNSLVLPDDGKKRNTGGQSSCIAADTAEPSVRDIENITEEVPVDEEGQQMRRPVGKGK